MSHSKIFRKPKTSYRSYQTVKYNDFHKTTNKSDIIKDLFFFVVVLFFGLLSLNMGRSRVATQVTVTRQPLSCPIKTNLLHKHMLEIPALTTNFQCQKSHNFNLQFNMKAQWSELIKIFSEGI